MSESYDKPVKYPESKTTLMLKALAKLNHAKDELETEQRDKNVKLLTLGYQMKQQQAAAAQAAENNRILNEMRMAQTGHYNAQTDDLNTPDAAKGAKQFGSREQITTALTTKDGTIPTFSDEIKHLDSFGETDQQLLDRIHSIHGYENMSLPMLQIVRKSYGGGATTPVTAPTSPVSESSMPQSPTDGSLAPITDTKPVKPSIYNPEFKDVTPDSPVTQINEMVAQKYGVKPTQVTQSLRDKWVAEYYKNNPSGSALKMHNIEKTDSENTWQKHRSMTEGDAKQKIRDATVRATDKEVDDWVQNMANSKTPMDLSSALNYYETTYAPRYNRLGAQDANQAAKKRVYLKVTGVAAPLRTKPEPRSKSAGGGLPGGAFDPAHPNKTTAPASTPASPQKQQSAPEKKKSNVPAGMKVH